MDPCERCKLLIVSKTLGYLIGGETCSVQESEMTVETKKDRRLFWLGVFLLVCTLFFGFNVNVYEHWKLPSDARSWTISIACYAAGLSLVIGIGLLRGQGYR